MTSAALIALEGSKEEEECFFPERDMMRVKLFFRYTNATMNSLSLSLSGDVCVTKNVSRWMRQRLTASDSLCLLRKNQLRGQYLVAFAGTLIERYFIIFL